MMTGSDGSGARFGTRPPPQNPEIHTDSAAAAKAPVVYGSMALVFALFALMCLPLTLLAWLLGDVAWFALIPAGSALVWISLAVACGRARKTAQRRAANTQTLLAVLPDRLVMLDRIHVPYREMQGLFMRWQDARATRPAFTAGAALGNAMINQGIESTGNAASLHVVVDVPAHRIPAEPVPLLQIGPDAEVRPGVIRLQMLLHPMMAAGDFEAVQRTLAERAGGTDVPAIKP